MHIRLDDQKTSRISQSRLLSQRVDCNDGEWTSPARPRESDTASQQQIEIEIVILQIKQ
jgi:hypothetical protein